MGDWADRISAIADENFCRYECALAARNINLGLALGHRVNVWEQIAEMARRGIAGMDEAFDQAWALSGLPMDADRMDEAA